MVSCHISVQYNVNGALTISQSTYIISVCVLRPVYECDEDLETNYHFLMDCRQYNDALNIIIANIQKMWMDTKATGILNTTMELILGSCSVFNLDKELVKYIKIQLFQYL